jgi:hypothetical protein
MLHSRGIASSICMSCQTYTTHNVQSHDFRYDLGLQSNSLQTRCVKSWCDCSQTTSSTVRLRSYSFLFVQPAVIAHYSRNRSLYKPSRGMVYSFLAIPRSSTILLYTNNTPETLLIITTKVYVPAHNGDILASQVPKQRPGLDQQRRMGEKGLRFETTRGSGKLGRSSG